jgi:hypothetical protein
MDDPMHLPAPAATHTTITSSIPYTFVIGFYDH